MVENIELKENELLEIRGDRIFHDLFNEQEMDTIEWLVMKILDCKYEDIHGKVSVGNIRSVNMTKDDKEKYLDLVVNYKNQIIDIELNNNANGEYLRNACYIGNRVINSYLVGSEYDKLTQGILVNLNWFTENENKNHPETVVEEIWEYPSLKKNKPEYLIKFINVNLGMYKDMCYTSLKEKEIVWKLFTINNREELDSIVKKEKMLNNYYKKLQRLSKDKEYCRMIWDERLEENLRNQDAYRGGRSEGYELGKNAGIEQKQNEMVINFYKNGVSLELISKSSGLSIDEIKKIINNNKACN